MTIQDIICFLSVAETLSYTQTAQRLNISQPAVTKHITAMEKEFDLPLIDRSNRRAILLTEAGHILFEALKTGKTAYDAALRRLKTISANTPVVTCLPNGISVPLEYLVPYNSFAQNILPTKIIVSYHDYPDFAPCLENGGLLLCEQEAIPAAKKTQSLEFSTEPVPHCLIASAQHPVFSDCSCPAIQDFADSPVFFTDTMPQALVDKYIACLTEQFGKKPAEIIYLNGIDSIYLYLHANQGITVNTAWAGMIHSKSMRAVELPISTRYYVTWCPDKFVNSYIPTLRKVLENH